MAAAITYVKHCIVQMELNFEVGKGDVRSSGKATRVDYT